MSGCPEHRERLWLDVHDELDPAEGQAWQDHLARCPGCREERERLVRVLGLARKAMPTPEQSPERARALREAIVRGQEEERSGPWWRKVKGGGLSWPPRPAWALVAAGLAIMAAGYFMTGPDRGREPARTALETGARGGPDRAKAKEAEILANLEILEEMEVLRKVVKAVDQKDVAI